MPSSPDDGGRMSRRDFSRRAALAAGGLVLAAHGADAAPAAPPKTTKAVEDLTDSLMAASPGLKPEERPEVLNQVKSTLDFANSLRSHPVADGAEPGFVFRALLLETEGGHAE